MNIKMFVTDYLVSKSGIIDGLSTIIDLSGSFYKYNTSQTAEASDRKAIRNDWHVIGQDLRNAYAKKKTYSK